MSYNKSVLNGRMRFDNKYYTRLLIVFIIVIITFMVIIAVTTYIGNYKTIERNFHVQSNDLFSIYSRNLQYNMDIVFNMNHQMISDNNLLRYLSLKKNFSSSAQLILADFIRSLYNRVYSLKFVHYMGVYLPDDDRIIHEKGAESGRDFFNSFTFEGMNYKQFNELLNKKQRYDIITIKAADSTSDSLVCVLNNSMINYERLSIVTFLKPELLAEKSPDEDGNKFIYSEDAGFIASTGGHEIIPPDVLQQVIARQSGTLKFNSGHQDYYLYFGYYKPLQWHYGYLAPLTPLRSEISRYTLWTVMLVAPLILLGVFLAFVLAGVAYKPVGRVLSRLQIEKQSSGKVKLDEFELISQNFFAVKHNNTILHRKLENSKSILKSSLLKDLLYGNSPENVREKLESSLDIRFDRNFFQVLLLDIDGLAMIEHKSTEEVAVLLKQDIFSTAEFYFRKVHPCEILEAGFGRLAVLLNYDSENIALADVVREIQSLAKKELNITITVSTGGIYQNISGFSLSFKEALQVMEYKYALNRENILTLADIEAFSTDTFYYPLEKERFIINAAVNGDFQVVKPAVLEILEDNFINRSLKSEVRYHLLSAMAGTLIRIFHTINMTPGDVFGKDYDIYDKIRDFNDFYLFKNKILNIYQALCDKILETRSCTEDKLKKKMLACIENNYHRDDFSLNDMAGQFNLSSTYFSDLFKERTGENFIDYLIRYRLDKAKELMSGTNLKINEIAGRVGYNNTTSFIRAFKKYEGVSPGKFKDIHF